MWNVTASLTLSAAAALLFRASPAVAQATPVTVSVDARGAGTPLKRVWPYFGYDEVNYTTTALGSSLLTALGSFDTGPSYIRPHFLLNTGDGVPAHKWGSTNVYTEDATGQPIYDWTTQDRVIDTIGSTGNLPFVEIGFMPQALSSRPDPYRNSTVTALDGGCFYPPRDYDKWGALIGQWARHAKQRYPDTVASWIWELWNEPNIGYWHGTFDEYAKLFDYTESALHAELPAAVLGGPAVTGPVPFLQQFLAHCAQGTNGKTGQTGTRLDLVSFHAKGGVAISGNHPQMDLGNQLRLHRDGFATVASFPQYRQTPIVISEADPDGCAACSSPANVYRNSPAYGAYEVAMMKRSLDLEARAGVNLKGLVTWAFMFDDDPYFGIFRTLASRGVHKAVLNDFKLLGALRGQRMPLTSSGARPLDDVLVNSVRVAPDVDALASSDGEHVQVLVWNYHDDLVPAPPSPVHLAIALPASFGTNSAAVSHLRVDEAHGDPYSVWVAQGSPASPSATQRAALELAMQPAAFEPMRTVAVVNGSVAVDFDLPRFGVSLVTFTSAAASTGDAGAAVPSRDAGLPDARRDAGLPDALLDVSTAPVRSDTADAVSEAVPSLATPSDATSVVESGNGDNNAGPLLDSSAMPVPQTRDATGGRSDASTGDDGGCSCTVVVAHGSQREHRDPLFVALAALATAALARWRGRQRRTATR